MPSNLRWMGRWILLSAMVGRRRSDWVGYVSRWAIHDSISMQAEASRGEERVGMAWGSMINC